MCTCAGILFVAGENVDENGGRGVVQRLERDLGVRGLQPSADRLETGRDTPRPVRMEGPSPRNLRCPVVGGIFDLDIDLDTSVIA